MLKRLCGAVSVLVLSFMVFFAIVLVLALIDSWTHGR